MLESILVFDLTELCSRQGAAPHFLHGQLYFTVCGITALTPFHCYAFLSPFSHGLIGQSPLVPFPTPRHPSRHSTPLATFARDLTLHACRISTILCHTGLYHRSIEFLPYPFKHPWSLELDTEPLRLNQIHPRHSGMLATCNPSLSPFCRVIALTLLSVVLINARQSEDTTEPLHHHLSCRFLYRRSLPSSLSYRLLRSTLHRPI